MFSDTPGLVRFEGYVIDRARWQLRYRETPLPLNRKTFDLLLYLIDHADRVVSKDELLRALWPESFIEESNLTQQIFLLRKALAKHDSGTRIIETVPGRGYRFAVAVHHEQRPVAQDGMELAAPPAGMGPAFDGHGSEPGSDAAHHPSAPPADRPEIDEAPRGPGPFPAASQGHVPGVRHGPFRVLGMAAVAALLALTLLLAIRPGTHGHLSIALYKQITHDGHAKSIGGTDGSRIYFTRLEKSSIAQMPLSGGMEATMQLGIQDPWTGDVSPDGSTLLVISHAGGQGPAASLWALQLVGGSLRRLGNAISSAWSPDGEQIVYASVNGELFLMRRDGSGAHRIAAVGGYISSIAWSPDGRVIRFSRDGLLWQVSPTGADPHRLLPGWGKAPTQWSGQWAPDGTYFFVADGQIWRLASGSGFAWREAPAPVQLTNGPMVWDRPILTPDGKRILASARTSRGELVRFDPKTGQPRTFLGGISAEFVAFSARAHSIAYVSYPEGILWRANLDGSNPVQLTEPPVYPKSICWSPDGSRLAFVDRTARNVASVFVLAAEAAAKPQPLLPGDTEAENDPSWSPDGKHLIFSTSPNVGASGRSDLRILDLTTGKAAPLAGSEGLLVPHWSPDGASIAAMTLDARSLRVLHLASGQWSTLNTGAVAFPEWSHDGQWIYYVRWTADAAIRRIRVADGKQETLTDLTDARYTGFYTLWMGLDPGDSPMMLRDAGNDDIYALTLKRD